MPLMVYPGFITEHEGVLAIFVRSAHMINSGLMMIIVPYAFWNWRLAMFGVTQVEHTKKLFRFRDRQESCSKLFFGSQETVVKQRRK